QSFGFAGHAPPPPPPLPEPPPPPQSFGHDALVSPVSQVLLPQTGFGLLLPPPLPQSLVQLPTSLAAQTPSPQTGLPPPPPPPTAASGPPGPVPPSPPQLQPANAQTNTTALILIMRGIVLMPIQRST